MKKQSINANEIAISRTVIMLFMYLALSLFAWLYIQPFSRVYLEINFYYRYIEYAVICILAVLCALSIVFSYIKKGLPEDGKLITRAMLDVYSISALAAAIIMPVSHNRALSLRYCIISFVAITVSYAVYNLVNRAYAYQTVICAMYLIGLGLLNDLYKANVTFSDKINISYSSFILILVALILFSLVISYFVSKKNAGVIIWHTGVLSFIALSTIITRIFVYGYVIIIGRIVLILAWGLIIMYEKVHKKF